MKSLIICSGGLDSTTMALIAKKSGEDIGLITFNYGQKATKEIEAVKVLAEKYGCEHKVVDISFMKEIFGENQLTGDNVKVENDYKPSVVVPLRNSVFIQIAYIYAMANGYERLYLGSHLDDIKKDKNGDLMFPDCSPHFFNEINRALWAGCRREDEKVLIYSASILGWGKSELIKRGVEADADAVFKSWSCYTNGEKQCGVCDSCQNRRRSFAEAGVKDLTDYASL